MDPSQLNRSRRFLPPAPARLGLGPACSNWANPPAPAIMKLRLVIDRILVLPGNFAFC
jgi:hypothetical protein